MLTQNKKVSIQGCSSVVEKLPSKHEILGSLTSIGAEGSEEKKEGGKEEEEGDEDEQEEKASVATTSPTHV